MPTLVPKSAGSVCCCALVAGMCAAAEVRGQERPAVSGGATLQASATILPSIEAASFTALAAELPPTGNQVGPRPGTWLVTTPGPTDGATRLAALLEPPVARSLERIPSSGRPTYRHTIAVLY